MSRVTSKAWWASLRIAGAQDHIRLHLDPDLGLERGSHVDLGQGSETLGGEGRFHLGHRLREVFGQLHAFAVVHRLLLLHCVMDATDTT
jgi:hypothetical protein